MIKKRCINRDIGLALRLCRRQLHRFSYCIKFRDSLGLRRFSFYEKFFPLLALNLALYFNAIDVPFEKQGLWTYSIPALANATYVLTSLVYASGFLAFIPLAAYICFLYSLCVVICGVREKFQNLS